MIRNLYALIILESNPLPLMREELGKGSITPQQLQQRYERYGSS